MATAPARGVVTDPIIAALAEIKRRATHLDRTGYITVHEDELREALAEVGDAEIRRLRDCIVSARWRLGKGRALWNGPCHECDAALERALTGREPPADTRRAVIEE